MRNVMFSRARMKKKEEENKQKTWGGSGFIYPLPSTGKAKILEAAVSKFEAVMKRKGFLWHYACQDRG